MQYTIPNPSKDIFLYDNEKTSDIMNEGALTFKLEKIDYSDGIKVYIKGAKYPKKGFVTPEAIWSCNIIKRLIMIYPLWTLIFGFKKLLPKFNTIGYKVLKSNILKLHFLTPVAQELHILIKTFLCHLGIPKAVAYETAVILSHLIEYDDAYRYRIQDIFSEITKDELLQSPRTTIDKMMLILYSRDSKGVADKFNRLATLFYLALCIPKFNKAYYKTMEICRIESLQYDDADRYWILNRSDYKFMGKTFEERYASMDPKPQGFRLKYE